MTVSSVFPFAQRSPQAKRLRTPAFLAATPQVSTAPLTMSMIGLSQTALPVLVVRSTWSKQPLPRPSFSPPLQPLRRALHPPPLLPSAESRDSSYLTSSARFCASVTRRSVRVDSAQIPCPS